MNMHVSASARVIARAINRFNPDYHREFFSTRRAAKRHLAQPNASNAERLAKSLQSALLNWGAGRRRAPRVKIVSDMAKYLAGSAHAFSDLAELHRRVSQTRIERNCPRLAGEAGRSFDQLLLDALKSLSTGLFHNNTGVTYPMKALLLITGLMPALDSQVRRGLGRAGFSGFEKTQFRLPDDARTADGMKITGLLFVIGRCFKAHRSRLLAGVRASRYPQLGSETGRLFDVLLFMSGREKPSCFRMAPRVARWYAG